MEAYSFRRATKLDIGLLNAWLDTPEVASWWIDAEGKPSDRFDSDYFDDPDTRAWIVSLADVPFAFIQDYSPHAWPGHHFAHLPPGSRGVDQFIGVPEMIGSGHGSAFITQFTDQLMHGGVPAIGTDPHPENARAIRAYGKAGFIPIGTSTTDWGPALLMEKRQAKLLDFLSN